MNECFCDGKVIFISRCGYLKFELLDNQMYIECEDCNYNDYIEINYCPYCGKKLETEENA